jgi:hypothetical protein
MQILKANIQRLTCLNPAAKKCRDVLLYAIGLNDVLILKCVNPRSFNFREGKIDIKRIRSSISIHTRQCFCKRKLIKSNFVKAQFYFNKNVIFHTIS